MTIAKLAAEVKRLIPIDGEVQTKWGETMKAMDRLVDFAVKGERDVPTTFNQTDEFRQGGSIRLP
jgi:hypothetical protein